MSHTLVSLACHAYGIAAVVYLAYLVRQSEALATAGRVLVGGGLALHGVALFELLGVQSGRPVGLAQGFSALAFLLLAIFLFLDVRYRRPVIGAFLTPLALAALLPGLLLQGGQAPLPPGVRQPLLPLHITLALMGLAAFAVAAGVGVMYVLMERQVKAKRFGLLFSRLPSLEFLDTLNRRLVVWASWRCPSRSPRGPSSWAPRRAPGPWMGRRWPPSLRGRSSPRCWWRVPSRAGGGGGWPSSPWRGSAWSWCPSCPRMTCRRPRRP